MHLVDSAVSGRLTAAKILAGKTAAPDDLSVFLCRPEAMLRDLQAGLRSGGVRSKNIHREYFDWR